MPKKPAKKKKRRQEDSTAADIFDAVFGNICYEILFWPLRMLWRLIRFFFRSIGDLIP
ncbi:hypothetical protein [Bacillus aerolatus]|uniref:hypothetical protein n=1 Tax=Bacillus aerolatus TaxID=2653354 RepID=UPI001786990A|nr:hypothetical protein [Bacillus aerolatus]